MTRFRLVHLTLFLVATALQQSPSQVPAPSTTPSPLDVKITNFDVTDAILRDGLSELSLKHIGGFHLGFEEIVRDRIQDDPRALSSHFSVHLENRSVKDILDTLCQADPRYTWSADGASINVYPRQVPEDSSYLLNLQLEHVTFSGIARPEQALTTLSKTFPDQQVGYFGPGLGDNSYIKPWTAAFEHLTVRQFVNRIAEHMGEQTAWVWEGGRQQRMFTFLKGGFNTERPHP